MDVLAAGVPPADAVHAPEEPVLGGRLLQSINLPHATVGDVAWGLGLRCATSQTNLTKTEPELVTSAKHGPVSPVEPDLDQQPAMDLLAYYRAPQRLTKYLYATEPTRVGIFLTTGGVEVLARFLMQDGHSLSTALSGAAQALYLHEMFHHIVAAGSAILEREASGKPYTSYRSEGDEQLGYNPLEEQMSNAFMLRHMDSSLRPSLDRFLLGQPVGYRDAAGIDSLAAMSNA